MKLIVSRRDIKDFCNQKHKMAWNILVYWIGIIGVPGKGPAYVESYNSDRTIGDVIQAMMSYRLGDGKQINILKFKPGDLSRVVDNNNPYWPHDTKLSEYVSFYGGSPVNDVFMAYVF